MPRYKHPKPSPPVDYEMSDAALFEASLVEQSEARSRFDNVEPGISVRESMNTRSADFFRWDERTPKAKNEKILACDRAYRTNPLVKSTLDMMTDFVCQGIELYHNSPTKQDRYRCWWKRVNGDHVSYTLVNHLLRHGGVGINRAFSKLSTADIKDLESTQAADEIPYVRSPDVIPNRIPLQYTILNPTSITPMGGSLAMFAGTKRYGITLDNTLASTIRNPKTAIEREIVATLPAYILEAAKSPDKTIPIDPERIEMIFYKKDDWQYWPDPLVMSIYKDILLYDKMKEADRAALDGAASLRLWTVGRLDANHKMPPSPDAMNLVKSQLLASVPGGRQDFVFPPTLDFKESNSDSYKFLGPVKYEEVIRSICVGLGLPHSMGGGGGGGLTNNALELKTLLERLQYARKLLVRFWEGEFERLRLAFGDRHASMLRFSNMSLSDDAAEKMIWIQLYDRHLLSDETMQERFGEIPEIEVARMRREAAQRTAEKRPARQGPFNEQAGHPDQARKAVLTQGLAAPSQVGVKLDPKAEGDESLLDRQEKQALKTAKIAAKNQPATPGNAKKPGVAGQGRPRGKKDEGGRKQRTPKVRQAKASLFTSQVKARANLKVISEVVTPAFLAQAGKKNLRGLSTVESERLEMLKFALLMEVPLDGEVDRDYVASHLDDTPLLQHLEVLNALTAEAFAGQGVIPTVEDSRELQVSAYVLINLTEDDDGDLDDPD